MQLVAQPHTCSPAACRRPRQPSAAPRAPLTWLPSVRPRSAALFASATDEASRTARAQHDEQPLVMPASTSAHPARPSSEPQPAAPVTNQTSSGFVATVGKTLACLAVATVLCLGNAGNALAARSGGYVGGSGFRAAPSRSFSSPRSSYSSPSFSSPYRAPPPGAAMPRRSGSATIIVPGPSFSPYASPFSPFSPFSPYAPPFSPYAPGPMVMGPRMAPPVVVSPLGSMATQLVVAVGVTLWVASMARRAAGAGSATITGSQAGPLTVARVQVGALAVARELKAELDQLAAQADTSNPQGLHALLQEVVLALLRHPEYCVLAHSSSRTLGSPEEAERAYNKLALEARSTYDQDTLVNYGGRPLRRSQLSTGSGGVDELLVVSLVVAGEGAVKLPPINSWDDLQAVLKRLAALSPSELKAVQLTWTPQAKGDALSQEEVLEHFPQLQPLL